MNIVIDARYLGMSGIGRFLEGVVENLPNIHTYYFLGNKEKITKYVDTLNIIEDNTNPFTPKGLFINKEINKYDLFFTPNFIIPLNVKIKVYSVIHDVIFLEMKETTNNYIDYRIKKYLLKRCTKKSNKIFTVSNFSKNRIKYFFPKTKCDIILTYTGLSKSIINYKENNQEEIEKKPYLIFIGNIKKNKGLKTLVEAMPQLNNYKLYIVGNKDGFRTGNNDFDKYLENPNIIFTGYIADNDMYKLIQEATYLVQPSLYEGFGLPPLEALYLGTKPIISDIEVFKEIYKDLDVVYFKTGDSQDLIAKINNSDYKINKELKDIPYNFKLVANKIFNNI